MIFAREHQIIHIMQQKKYPALRILQLKHAMVNWNSLKRMLRHLARSGASCLCDESENFFCQLLDEVFSACLESID
jgi:hypothetical protein